jgi:KaiC/GvpD/RAD55 family RecA-like ATPase
MAETPTRLSTGINGLDDVLNGGYLRGDGYLLRGEPGTGKTLLGLHFLRAGVDAGETSPFVTFAEAKEKIHRHSNSVVRKNVIGVLKKRTTDYERTLREFRITEHGISVGEPMTNLRGIRTGTPHETARGDDNGA